MLIIRKVEESDLSEVEELYISSIKDNKEGFIQRLDLRQNIKDFILSVKNSGGEFFIAILENKIIGMIGLDIIEDGKAEICKLHLKKEYKGRKFGEYIFDYVLKYAIGISIKKVILHVTKSQKPAINLYKKKNFSILKEKVCSVALDGEVCNYDTLFMEKEL